MADKRKKNVNWKVSTNHDGTTPNEHAMIAVLMDIRDELQRLNAALYCPNFMQIPDILRRIRGNTQKKKKLRIRKTG